MAHIESPVQTHIPPTIPLFDRVRQTVNPRRILRVGAIGATLLSPLSLSRETQPHDIPDFYGTPTYVAGRAGETKYGTLPGADILCFPQDAQEIAGLQNEYFQPSDFVDISTNPRPHDTPLFQPNGKPTYPENTHVLFLHVGNDDSSTCLMDYFTHMFNRAFEQLPLTISYLKRPVPIPFTRANEHILQGLQETEVVLNSIRTSTGRRYRKVLVFLNTGTFVGITNNNSQRDISFIPLHNPESLYITLHEGGHLFGLDDGYRHNLSFKAALTSSELTFGHNYTDDEAQEATDPQNLDRLLPTGIVIHHKQVFARDAKGFEGNNVMRSSNSNNIMNRLNTQKPIFSPFQVRYMRAHIKRTR